MNMTKWRESVIYGHKKAFPLVSFPAVQPLYVTVKELVCDSSLQALGMRMIADRYDMLASTGYMDLSVEAEAFGAMTVYGTDEIPTIIGRIVSSEEDAMALKVPKIGAGRTATNIEAIRKATILIKDRPIFANAIGPFSLAGRLINVNDIMVDCFEEPDMVHIVLKKATEFIIKYIKELKKAGANGVILAEPLAGILSPNLMHEFSSGYVKQIVNAVEDNQFLVIYHNCGTSVNSLIPQLLETGCSAFHFGEKADLKDLLEKMPSDYLIFGNISSATVFNNSTAREMNLKVRGLLERCKDHRNFVISSSCDVPPNTDFSQIDTFFKTIEEYYYKQSLLDMVA